jgi:hypothetical protein
MLSCEVQAIMEVEFGGVRNPQRLSQSSPCPPKIIALCKVVVALAHIKNGAPG